jgi:hypothetical protein
LSDNSVDHIRPETRLPFAFTLLELELGNVTLTQAHWKLEGPTRERMLGLEMIDIFDHWNFLPVTDRGVLLEASNWTILTLTNIDHDMRNFILKSLLILRNI